LEDPDGTPLGGAAFRGINLNDLHVAYQQFCTNERINNSPIDLALVIDFYNQTIADLPDPARLKGFRAPAWELYWIFTAIVSQHLRAISTPPVVAARGDSWACSAGLHLGGGQAIL
jgi:hypothetical protein